MDLAQFVQTTLEQVIRGVTEAQTAAGKLGGYVNPQMSSGKSGEFHSQTGSPVQRIEFDVAVTVSEGAASGAALQVGGSWFGGSVKGESDRNQTAQNRVRFAIPIAFPVQPGVPMPILSLGTHEPVDR
jgi:hypothetical protein